MCLTALKIGVQLTSKKLTHLNKPMSTLHANQAHSRYGATSKKGFLACCMFSFQIALFLQISVHELRNLGCNQVGNRFIHTADGASDV